MNTLSIAEFSNGVYNLTNSYSDIPRDYEQLIDSQRSLRREYNLHPTCTQLLSREDIDLEARSYMAYRISEESNNDLAIIYLIANEIAEAISGEINPYYKGFLITIDHEFAVLVEHGIYLKYSDDSEFVVNELASKYSYVLLASCDSYKYAKNYKNVDGFTGMIRVSDVVSKLKNIQKNTYKKFNELSSNAIIDYMLYVTYPRDFVVLSPFAIYACNRIVNLNRDEHSIYNTFFLYVTLQKGTSQWGGKHINEKCGDSETQEYVLSDDLISEILLSPSSLCAIIEDARAASTLMYKAVIFKLFPINTDYILSGENKRFNVADVVIGPDPRDLVTGHLTILTMHVHGSMEWNKFVLAMLALITAVGGAYYLKDIKEWPDLGLPKIRLESAFVIREMDVPIPQSYGDSEDELVEDSVNFLWELAVVGSILLLIALWQLDDILITRFGYGTARYYTVWTAIVIAVVVTLIVVGIIAYYIAELAAAVITILGPWTPFLIRWLVKVFAGGAAAVAEGFPDDSFDPLTPEDIDVYASFYDDDNDGIPNDLETSYHEEYIEEVIKLLIRSVRTILLFVHA
ncbi:MAG: hypothetical protein HGN29_17975 [Asgard group archaeon]|nr:hypothetical protein [Asgard group archaeon]